MSKKDPQISLTCPVCRSPLGDSPIKQCPDCLTRHHLECWEYIGGCSVYGCQLNSDTGNQIERVKSLKIPPETYLFFNTTRKPAGLVLLFLVFLGFLGVLLPPILQHGLLLLFFFFAAQKRRALLCVQTRFDTKRKLLVDESRLGPFIFWSSTRPIDDVSTISIDVGIEDTGLSRCVTAVLKISMKDGSTERLLFPEKDIEIRQEADRRLAWARNIADETGMNFISPCNHNLDVAIKNVSVLQETIDEQQSPMLYWPVETMWRFRWYLLSFSYLAVLYNSPSVFALYILVVFAGLLLFVMVERTSKSLLKDRPWQGVPISRLADNGTRKLQVSEGVLDTIAALSGQMSKLAESKQKSKLFRSFLYLLLIITIAAPGPLLILASSKGIFELSILFLLLGTYSTCLTQYIHNRWISSAREVAIGAEKLLNQEKQLVEAESVSQFMQLEQNNPKEQE